MQPEHQLADACGVVFGGSLLTEKKIKRLASGLCHERKTGERLTREKIGKSGLMRRAASRENREKQTVRCKSNVDGVVRIDQVLKVSCSRPYDES